MKYIKTFESFSPINEEEGIFGAIKNAFKSDIIEKQLETIIFLSKKNENEVRKVIDQIKSEEDLTKKEELLKSLIGDYDNIDVHSKLIKMGLKTNQIRYELDCMTPEEKEEFEEIKGGPTGWEGSKGFH